MTRVSVRNGNLEFALKKLKQKNSKNGLPSEVKKREHYVKAGLKKRNAKKEAIKNNRKKIHKDRD